MPKEITSRQVEECLRKILKAHGYSLNTPREPGERGTDIIATKAHEELHIEVVGHEKIGWLRSREFYEAFFRAISRLEEHPTRCVIALAKQAEKGLTKRAAHYRDAWRRIGEAFPELEIWLVDTTRDQYSRTPWGYWLKGVLV